MTDLTATAANAINALGVDLLVRCGQTGTNTLLSPYSIQSALAMAYAGAEGDTRTEMAATLHYPPDEFELHASFGALRSALGDIVQKSARQCEDMKRWGETTEPLTLTVANRLFGQEGFKFRESFLMPLKESYDAPFESLDFANSSAAARHINRWIEKQTRQRIRDLIPERSLDELTRMVLVNALYLKAPWTDEFDEFATEPAPFHVVGHGPVDVPTMKDTRGLQYARRDGFSTVGIPYGQGDLQFLILLPDTMDGLRDLEARLSAELLGECASPGPRQVILHLPKFKIEPPMLELAGDLMRLGMRKAFDEPRGSANFDRIAQRRPEDYLCLSKVIHKAFLNLDEKGTEAAAATATVMYAGCSDGPTNPIEVRVDHPFVFAIQHRHSGACLFLGRVVDPR